MKRQVRFSLGSFGAERQCYGASQMWENKDISIFQPSLQLDAKNKSFRECRQTLFPFTELF